MRNVCFFRKIVHETSGQEIDPGFLLEGTYIETIDLDGPKLMLTFMDHGSYIKNTLKVKEYDEISVHFADDWCEDGISEKETFVVLTHKPRPDGTIAQNLLAKPVFEMKRPASKTRIFSQRGVSEIVAAYAGGLKQDLGQFPVVENYHCINGERPTTMLKQVAEEQGAHAWVARGAFHMQPFAAMFGKAPEMTYHHGTLNSERSIIEFRQPSQQLGMQEKHVRSFTGWNEDLGRVKSPGGNPVLAKAGAVPPSISASPSIYTLNNMLMRKKTAIDFTTLGDLKLTAGATLKLVWHRPDPENPIDEGLPEKVVVESVGHWYSSQKYYCRVKGAVPLEPTA